MEGSRGLHEELTRHHAASQEPPADLAGLITLEQAADRLPLALRPQTTDAWKRFARRLRASGVRMWYASRRALMQPEAVDTALRSWVKPTKPGGRAPNRRRSRR